MPKPKALYILNDHSFDVIYGPDERADLAALFEVEDVAYTKEAIAKNWSLLSGVKYILSGWGGPTLDETFLSHCPELKAVFYGAGSLKRMVTPAFWAKQIPITSSYGANAVAVVEYTLAQILLCTKRSHEFNRMVRRDRAYAGKGKMTVAGNHKSTVGLVSLGMIARQLLEKLALFEHNIIAYDPFCSEADAKSLGVTLVGLEDVFAQADVVSLHTPWLKETENLIRASHFEAMKPNSAFINTSRGAVVHEEEMLAVLESRQDIQAIIDVTYPEPPAEDSKIYTLENVYLTPHIAGSMNNECRRMGRIVVDEATRLLNGEPLQWSIDEKRAEVMA